MRLCWIILVLMKTMAIGDYTNNDNDYNKDDSYTYFVYKDSEPLTEEKMENRVDKKIDKETPEEMFKFQMGIPDGILKMNNKISAFSGLSIEPVDTFSQDQVHKKVHPHQTFITDEKVAEKVSVEEEEDPKEVVEMITVEQTAQSTTERQPIMSGGTSIIAGGRSDNSQVTCSVCFILIIHCKYLVKN